MSCHRIQIEDLQRQGVRLTAQRAFILEDMCHHSGHRTAEQVYQDVSERLPGLNRATVYRTLNLLREAGLVSMLNHPDGITKYELVRQSDEPHHHLHCRRCGEELALDRAPVERLKADIRRRTGFEAEIDHLALVGLCAACAGASSAPPRHEEA
jgi:Fur family ferric uptake transcriptional regulator